MSRNEPSPQPASELRQLISDQCSGTLGSEGQARLESMLAASEESRKFYLLYTAVHARLRRRFRGHSKEWAALTLDASEGKSVAASADERSIARGEQIECKDAQAESNTTRKLSTTSTAISRAIYVLHSRPGLLSLAIAALVMCLLVTAMAFMSPPFFRALTRNHESVPTGQYDIVAEVTGLHEVELHDANHTLQHGAFLVAGRQLRVKEGLVQITYHTGALVVLEGPASYTIQGANGGDLQHGKLVARVDTKEALGFAVDIPGARIVDLGTEFGVEVTTDGKAEVAVLTGEVELVGKANASGAPQKLAANEIATVDAVSGKVVRREKADGQLLAAMSGRLDRFRQPLPARMVLAHYGLEETLAPDSVASGLTASSIAMPEGGFSSVGPPEGNYSRFIRAKDTGSINPPTVSDIKAVWTLTPDAGRQIVLDSTDSVTWKIRAGIFGTLPRFEFHAKLFVSSDPDFRAILAASRVFSASANDRHPQVDQVVDAIFDAPLTSTGPLYFGLAFTDTELRDVKANGRFDAIYINGIVAATSDQSDDGGKP